MKRGEKHTKSKVHHQGGNQQKQKKKGAPHWKRVLAEIKTLSQRIEEETPPKGVLYYKFKADEGKNDDQKDEGK